MLRNNSQHGSILQHVKVFVIVEPMNVRIEFELLTFVIKNGMVANNVSKLSNQ